MTKPKLSVNVPKTAAEVAAQWTTYCARLSEVGNTIIDEYANQSPEQAAEAIVHLSRLLRTSLEWQMDSQDSKHPRLMWYDRSCAGVAPYGPNLDNTYLLVRVDDGESYRLTVDVERIDEINISLHTGSPYDGDKAVYGDLNLADLDIVDGVGTIVFSRKRMEGAWFELPEGAQYAFIRFFYFDWDKSAPPAIEFERLGDGPPGLSCINPADFARGLSEAAHWMEGAIRFGHAFGVQFTQATPPNTPGAPRSVPGGGGKIRYGGFRFRLEADEALIFEMGRPNAKYWSVQWQRTPWGDPVDVKHHIISLNHTQTHVDADNRVRVVLAHNDPGVKNWLSTAGCREGFITFRWIWADSDQQPTARVIKLNDVQQSLPEQTPDFSHEQRVAQLAGRRRHLSLRY